MAVRVPKAQHLVFETFGGPAAAAQRLTEAVGSPSSAYNVKRFCTSRLSRDVLGLSAIVLAGVVILCLFKWRSLRFEEGVALVAALLGACGWAYVAANARFGAADILAAEIRTVCRVWVALDLTNHLIGLYKSDQWPRAFGGGSGQDYTAVFAKDTRDLEVLDGKTVDHVTEFYVYFKALRDSMANLSSLGARIDAAPSPATTGLDRQKFKAAALGTIYIVFLMFESAGNAFDRLIDDADTLEDSRLTTVLSALPAFTLLVHECRDGVRERRLAARKTAYAAIVEKCAELGRRLPADHPRRVLAESVLKQWSEMPR